MVPKPNTNKIDIMDEICASCGKRYGQHYGSSRTSVCTKPGGWLGGVPVDYKGQYWKPTGKFMNKEGQIYHTESNDPEPNEAFKAMTWQAWRCQYVGHDRR